MRRATAVKADMTFRVRSSYSFTNFIVSSPTETKIRGKKEAETKICQNQGDWIDPTWRRCPASPPGRTVTTATRGRHQAVAVTRETTAGVGLPDGRRAKHVSEHMAETERQVGSRPEVVHEGRIRRETKIKQEGERGRAH